MASISYNSGWWNHFKGKFQGVMFVATTKDANEQIYPFAFAFGDEENDQL